MINKIKITLLLIITVIIPNLILAQKVELTLGGGISKYNFRQAVYPCGNTPNETPKDNLIFSGIAGADVKWNLAKNIDCKVGLNYSTKGNREHKVADSYFNNQPDTTIHWKMNELIRLHYFELPITIHFRKIYTFVGGQISYLWAINTQGHDEITSIYNGQVLSSESKEYRGGFNTRPRGFYPHVDLGIILGIEYPIHKSFDIALRYYQGLRGIPVGEYTSCVNSQLLLTLTYCLTKDKVE